MLKVRAVRRLTAVVCAKVSRNAVDFPYIMVFIDNNTGIVCVWVEVTEGQCIDVPRCCLCRCGVAHVLGSRLECVHTGPSAHELQYQKYYNFRFDIWTIQV